MKKILTLFFMAVIAASCSSDGDTGISIDNIAITTKKPTEFILDSASGGATLSMSISGTDFEYGVCYDRNPNVTVENASVVLSNNESGGNFTCALTNIQPTLHYYARAFVRDGSNIKYGNEVSFILPTIVTTESIQNITASSFEAIIYIGNVNAPIERRGICFNTDRNPTVENFSMFTDGTIAGNETFTVTNNVLPNTTYYFRSFIVSGAKVYYGNEVTYKSAGYAGPSGGYVFLDRGDAASGWRYMETAPAKMNGTYPWGCSGTLLASNYTEIGDGVVNTSFMRLCPDSNTVGSMVHDAVISGKEDWFLPSIAELKVMYGLKSSGILSSFTSILVSSSQSSATQCYTVNFSNGAVAEQDKSAQFIAWPVRRY